MKAIGSERLEFPSRPFASDSTTILARPRRACPRSFSATLVLNFDFGLANRVGHGLGALINILADHELFRHAGFLGDHRLLAALLHLDGALLERIAAERASLRRAGDGAALHMDALLAQVHLLLHGTFHHAGLDANTATAGLALANMEILFHHRDHLVTPARVADVGSGPGRIP